MKAFYKIKASSNCFQKYEQLCWKFGEKTKYGKNTVRMVLTVKLLPCLWNVCIHEAMILFQQLKLYC